MLDREKMLKEIDEMPIEKLRECLCKALEDSGIEYHIYEDGEEVPECTTTLSDFLDAVIEDIRQLREEKLRENTAGWRSWNLVGVIVLRHLFESGLRNQIIKQDSRLQTVFIAYSNKLLFYIEYF